MQSDPAIPLESGSDAKSRLRQLISQKDALEAQLEALHTQAASGQPLVDAEGYPRADLDVHAVRNARNEMARMQTDHKRVMASIEQAMFALHAEAKAAKAAAHPELQQSAPIVRSGGAGTGAAREPAAAPRPQRDDGVPPPASAAAAAHADTSSSSAAAAAASLVPFYSVNAVSPDSPASVAGLRVGDLVLQFGSVTAANKSAASMAAVVSSSVGRALSVTVRRSNEAGGSDIKQLRLIPQQWGGRGMLGCHLVDV